MPPRNKRRKDRQIRSPFPSPDSDMGKLDPCHFTWPTHIYETSSSSIPPQSTPIQPKPARKRTRLSPPPPTAPERKKGRQSARKFSTELGHIFRGVISTTNRLETNQRARRIYELPVPDQVTHRLILYGDACIRNRSGAVGIVWKFKGSNDKWDGLGVGFPVETSDTNLVELYAIGCGLKLALENIFNAEYSTTHDEPADTTFLDPKKERTGSHSHGMTKEVFVFTDQEATLQRLDGTMIYYGNGHYATQIQAICDLSDVLSQLDVHVELHLSPGHGNVAGNNATHDMSRRAQRELFPPGANDYPAKCASMRELETIRAVVVVDSAGVSEQPDLPVPSHLPLRFLLPLRPLHRSIGTTMPLLDSSYPPPRLPSPPPPPPPSYPPPSPSPVPSPSSNHEEP